MRESNAFWQFLKLSTIFVSVKEHLYNGMKNKNTMGGAAVISEPNCRGLNTYSFSHHLLILVRIPSEKKSFAYKK